MADKKYPVPTSNPNKMMVVCFFVVWLVNLLVFAVANMLMPESVVLGTVNIPYTAALLLSSGVLAWVTTLFIPAFTEIEMRKKMVMSPIHWTAGYLIIDFIALWLIARQAEILGLGISSWMLVLVLSVILDVLQGMSMMAIEMMKQKK